MNVEKIIDIVCQGKNDEKVEDFLKFLSDKLWNQYKEHLMDNILVAENKVKSFAFSIPNAKEGKEYSQTVNVPDENMVLVEVSGISEEMHGLTITVAEDGHSFTISGLPTLEPLRNGGTTTAESTFELTLCYKYKGIFLPEDRPVLERKIPFVINQDPRKLWKNLPVDWENMLEPRYQNEDVQCEYVKVEALDDGAPQKDIVAASKRGRSHAQEAKPRDDHFKMAHLENGWYIMAVADGAGSAPFSREGSRIACETAVDYCKEQLLDSKKFEEEIDTYDQFKEDSESEARKMVGDYIYKIVGTAAFRAHKAIYAEATSKNQSPKIYATTFLLTICKKFSYGWFVASFWVGDGAPTVEPETPDTPSTGDTTTPNGDFETWVDGKPNNWKTASTAGNATLAQSTDAHSGKYSVKVGGSTSANKRLGYKEMELKAGTYKIKYYVKAATATGASVNSGFVEISAENKPAGNYVYSGYINDITNTEWKLVEQDLVIPSDGKYCIVIMNTKKPGGDVLIDDL